MAWIWTNDLCEEVEQGSGMVRRNVSEPSGITSSQLSAPAALLSSS